MIDCECDNKDYKPHHPNCPGYAADERRRKELDAMYGTITRDELAELLDRPSTETILERAKATDTWDEAIEDALSRSPYGLVEDSEND